LIRQLRAFSLKRRGGAAPVDVNAILDGLVSTLESMLGGTVRLEVRPGDDLPPISCDDGDLEEVLVNLALNARDAMQRGGRLLIETGVVELVVPAPPGSPDGRFVVITVTDDGVGMDDDVKARIFEPFFTTKPSARSIGLGLSTVYGIVVNAGGHVTVESELGRGSCFRLFFPAVGVESPGARRTEEAFGSETVLVCEDEPLVRHLSTRLLRAGGYRVLEAEDGERALAEAREHRGPIHLLVTDLDLPGIDGRELALRLGSERQGIRVLYISGLLEAADKMGLGRTRPDFLEKPFSATTLLHRVREVLDQSEVLA
jgi:CheY-like chemotaxis protein